MMHAHLRQHLIVSGATWWRTRGVLLNWRHVAALAVLIVGAIAMAVLHEKEIALVLAGAAAGYATTNNGRDREREREPAQRPAP
jgi:hypothetical protein